MEAEQQEIAFITDFQVQKRHEQTTYCSLSS